MTNETIFDVLQTAERLHIRVDETYRLLGEGKLEGAAKVRGCWAIPESTIEKRLTVVAAWQKKFRPQPWTDLESVLKSDQRHEFEKRGGL